MKTIKSLSLIAALIIVALISCSNENNRTDVIKIEYGNTEYYHLLTDGWYVPTDNGYNVDGAPYDYTILEDKVVVYVNQHLRKVEVKKGTGSIEYVNDGLFIYHGEIDDEIILKVKY